jgi:Fe-coproporphyrin III synthase
MQYTDETGTAGGSGTLMLHLLGRCNLECLHCYMEGSPSRREELPLDRVLDAIGECGELGVGNLYLTGGEPLLYRHLPRVIEVASRTEALQTIVCTNGMLVRKRHVEMFQSANARVNISVDGDEAFHDHFRQHRGALRATTGGIDRLVDAGIAVTIISTISRRNLHLVSSLASWAAQHGAREFRIQPLLRLGRGIEICDDRLANSEVNRLVLELTDLANRYRERLTIGMIGITKQFITAHPCGAYVCNGAGCHRRVAKEIKKLVVREDGTVLPEATNLSHDFALGNIDDSSLTQMVKRYFEDGYHRFDQLCRTAYAEVLPTWESSVVPWDQIIAERSRTWRPSPQLAGIAAACGAGDSQSCFKQCG